MRIDLLKDLLINVNCLIPFEGSGSKLTYREVYDRSISDPENFWGEVATGITWMKPWDRVLDHSNPPFTKWYVLIDGRQK